MISFWSIFGYLALFFPSLTARATWDAERLTLTMQDAPVAAARLRVDHHTPYGPIAFKADVHTGGTAAKATAELRNYTLIEPKGQKPPKPPVLAFSVDREGRVISREIPQAFPFDPLTLLKRRELTLRKGEPAKFQFREPHLSVDGTATFQASKPNEAEVVVRGEATVEGSKFSLIETLRFDRKAGRLKSAEYRLVDLRFPEPVRGRRMGIHLTLERL